MIISGWGRNKSINCKIIYPQNTNEIITIFKRNENLKNCISSINKIINKKK